MGEWGILCKMDYWVLEGGRRVEDVDCIRNGQVFNMYIKGCKGERKK